MSTTGGAAGGRPFRVLCVCEGNICRSPTAEVLLARALGPGVDVGSAGTRAVVGAPVAEPMEALLAARGLSSGDFRARQLVPAHVRDADVVLTMTARQRSKVAALVPAVVRRVFTLRELARLLDGAGADALPEAGVGERLEAALPVATARRAFVRDPRQDDIADPYGRDQQAYERAFGEVADAVDRLAAVLVPAR
ncbi:arsenate reductase/protein-tyrosine-phosphatase family protein [Microlunatus flavus]|uniref:Protein-tyrosine phosphatase n=1 Tax=Microlunatus flavus TaxID=1036181 RepID=A0A1H9H7B1_9ACTN|nr:hypothetical protein [Microlunatus flavus]SEQ58219.1 protein-tyrosine phosphatase [Microlunatus flavus]